VGRRLDKAQLRINVNGRDIVAVDEQVDELRLRDRFRLFDQKPAQRCAQAGAAPPRLDDESGQAKGRAILPDELPEADYLG